MKYQPVHSLFLAIGLGVLLVFLLGCSDPKLKSKWRDREITIDGADSEWEDCRQYYDKDTGTTLGIYNDDTHIYLRLATRDRTLQRRIIGQGLYTWFNPTGNRDKKVGILFPTGMMGKFIPGRNGTRAGRGDREGPGRDRRSDEWFGDNRRPGGHSAPLGDGPEMPSPDLEIHIPDRDYDNNILLEEVANYGFDAKLKHHGDRLVCELKIPLVENDLMPDIAVGAKSGRIGIGFMTKELDRKKMRGRSGGRGRGGPGGPGGPGGRGGGRGGGMGGPRGKGGGSGGPGRTGMGEMGKVYALWAKVELASRP